MIGRDELKERLDQIFSCVDDVEDLKRVGIKDFSTWAIKVDKVLDKIHELSWVDEDD